MHDLADFHLRNALRRGKSGGGTQALAGPAHEIFGVEDSDDVFGATLRIVDGDAGVLIVDYAGEGFVEVEIGGQRKNSGARDHHLAGRDAVEFEGIEQHLFLRRGELAGVVRGGDDKLEFVGRVDRAVADFASAEGAEDESGDAAHADRDRARDGEKDVYGCGYGQGDALGALQGERLGDEFAEDHVQAGDGDEGNGDGNGVGVKDGVWDAADPGLEEARQHGLAEPAEAEAGDRDS